MTIWNLGSINADVIFDVPRIPAPGETLASTGRALFLGGKGANMSVAAARAGAHVVHIGAVGADGAWAVERLVGYGVDVDHIREIEVETGQAIILVDPHGENAIVIHPGANRHVPETLVDSALSGAETGDWFVCQNETNLALEATRRARELGLSVAHAAAPFDAAAVEPLLPLLDLLLLNEVEAGQLAQATGKGPGALPVPHVVVTRGGDGCDWHDTEARRKTHIEAVKVTPVDVTGAGDTFTGYLLAGLDHGRPMEDALHLAARAAALMVTREGTADAIPDLVEVTAFRPA